MKKYKLNSYNLSKFKSFEYKKVLKKYNTKFKSSKDKLNACLYYVYWDSGVDVNNYIYFMYYSVLSFLFFTDANNIDIKIFINHERIEEFIELFSGISNNIELIGYHPEEIFWNIEEEYVSCKRKNKQRFANHPSLQKYDVAVLADADLFVYANNRNLFKDLLSIYKYNKKYDKNDKLIDIGWNYKAKSKVLMLNGPLEFNDIFERRRKDLAKMFKSKEEYELWFQNRLNINSEDMKIFKKSPMWFISALTIYQPGIHFSSEKWDKFQQASSDFQIMCDETIFITYCFSENIDISPINKTLSNIIEYQSSTLNKNISDLDISQDQLYILHELNGDNQDNNSKYIAEFFNYIEEKAKQKAEEV
ncbi:MAG: hypothetical protein ACOCP8_07210 [archaeon]